MIKKSILSVISLLVAIPTLTGIAFGASSNKVSAEANTETIGLTYYSASGEALGKVIENQEVTKLVNGVTPSQPNDKWCSLYENGASNYFCAHFQSAKPNHILTSYSLITGGDTASNPTRNWDSWKISGSDSSTSDWVLLVNHQNDSTLKATNYTKYDFNDVIAETKVKAYSYFKLEYWIDETQYTDSYVQQMGQMIFYGTNTYSISYKDQGGAAFSGTHVSGYPTTHTYGTATYVKEASKDNYQFDGWFTSSDCSGTRIAAINATGYRGTVTLYAKWTGNSFNIEYKDQGGKNFSGTHEADYPTTHSYGTDTELKGATKSTGLFLGWYDNSECTGSPITTIGATSHTLGKITLYAKWLNFSFKCHSVGGYYLNGDTKTPLASFGFEIISDSLDALLDQISDDGFGVYIYSSSTSETPTKAFETCTKAELVANEGRFYCIFDSGSDNTTYYAKGFFKIGDETFYSEITQATTNTNGSKYNID